MNIIEIIMILLGVSLFIIVGLATFYYWRIARLLRGGKGWGLFRFGVTTYLMAFVFVVVELITKDVTYSYLANLSLITGSAIFMYALIRIHSAMKEAMK